MIKEVFLDNFLTIREATSEEERNDIIKRMVNNFTMYVLSELNYDDYVIPNYVKRILEGYTFVYIDALNPINDYLKVYFSDFDIIFDVKNPVDKIISELGQKIKKYSRIKYIILYDEKDLDDIMSVFRQSEYNDAVDVLLLNSGYNGGDFYIRDKYSPYLIHKFTTYDNDIYNVIKESNRCINEFLAKIECEYKKSFFI